jgi:hypothetical protein
MAKPYHLGPARRAVNVVVTTMLRFGVGAKSTYLLTTTGRRTHQKRTTPVVPVETEEGRWLVSRIERWPGFTMCALCPR